MLKTIHSSINAFKQKYKYLLHFFKKEIQYNKNLLIVNDREQKL